jgi:arsenite methyltransferase
VLRPGGRIGITDIVAEDHLTAEQRAERGSYVGCIAGALSMSEFEAGLREVGLSDVTIRPTHSVAEGMVSAIVQATKPADSPGLAESPAVAREPARGLPLAVTELPLASNACCGGACCS